MTFISSLVPPGEHFDSDLLFLFNEEKLLVKTEEERPGIPTFADVIHLNLSFSREIYLGTLNGLHCHAAECNESPPSGQYDYQGLRLLFAALPEEILNAAGRAFQIIHWDRTHQFCGRCAAATVPKRDERVRVCPSCGLHAHPVVAPVIIVAVTRNGKLLLAHNRANKRNMFSIIAGFVEPGETLEECVHREVSEETGIEVKEIRYFGTQPWPFPSSLMIGFCAEYESGEIAVDGSEIDKAGWFSPEEFPLIPPPGSISRRLIDQFAGQSSSPSPSSASCERPSDRHK